MPQDRKPLKIVKAEPYFERGQRAGTKAGEKYNVRFDLSRDLTVYEVNLINVSAVDRPLGIGATGDSLPDNVMMAWRTTIEEVAEARDEIKAFLEEIESRGLAAEREAEEKADRETADRDTEEARRKAVADSINWD
ncbi:hypothetical protein A5757_19285 [Mycobacterium sp. 852013-51886_SCH5428379]|uniref:hypothetical protein n=1 Tax=Mycobacterium sp. 852013-51886_SCH5428379 TaxID=1834111 RepID=UPI000801C97F|nr:hypothetical protein [Mycobacterium sp. 852013-51886_SCH5428379]OBB57961.1 hypothetical protein A5757_19285 [Mycobacterium sp. 852013-51886_SCH5428379]